MLNIFSYAYLPTVYFLWWSICSGLWSMFLFDGFLIVEFYDFFLYFGWQSFIRHVFCKYCLQCVACLLILLTWLNFLYLNLWSGICFDPSSEIGNPSFVCLLQMRQSSNSNMIYWTTHFSLLFWNVYLDLKNRMLFKVRISWILKRRMPIYYITLLQMWEGTSLIFIHVFTIA